jgi:hypothetical protein
MKYENTEHMEMEKFTFSHARGHQINEGNIEIPRNQMTMQHTRTFRIQ